MSADPRSTRIGRRAVLAVGAALTLAPIEARAEGREPVGGKVAFRVPWPLTRIDPHRLDDATAGILGGALFDALYSIDDAGTVVPSLAEALPEVSGSRVVITLRAGLRSARGRGLTSKDVVASVARARAAGAQAWLAELGATRVESPLALSLPPADPAHVARALASPLTAIVPLGFVPERPDGTGAFRAERDGDALLFVRNELAANGPAFLDEVRVRPAPDLAASLSAFESGTDDIGWLGSGLHEPRPGARTFDAGACGWALLRTGSLAGAWDSPGIAQRLCDGIPPSRLAYLALGAPWVAEADDGWGGPPCELLVRDDSPWLRELCRGVAAAISRPSHEVSPRPVPVSEIEARRASRGYVLLIDVARPLGPGSLGALLALASSDDATAAVELARHPPRTEAPPRALSRTMRIGILGEIRLQGGRAADLSLATGASRIDLGATTRIRRGSP